MHFPWPPVKLRRLGLEAIVLLLPAKIIKTDPRGKLME
jgi:hypothetical protein